MKNFIIALLSLLLLSGCFSNVKTTQNTKTQNTIIVVKTTQEQFHRAFTNLPHYAQGIMSFEGSVNGNPTTLHFFHGSYRGFTLKTIPAKGMFVVCHAVYQPKQIQDRAVLVGEGRTRLTLISSTPNTLTFKVVEAKHLPFQRKLIEKEEADHAESLKDLGTITLK